MSSVESQSLATWRRRSDRYEREVSGAFCEDNSCQNLILFTIQCKALLSTEKSSSKSRIS